ncbi:MAG: 3-deoxy-manno-octulosonate cytidylyltransferase [Burkholderiales bacterium]|nr:3-deoxy-manno-octulosonate cytidylyltransferase [Burkholderiales bacterium]
MSFTVIIPARLASTRLPYKPLAPICGLPMIVRVALQAQKSKASKVIVACDAHSVLEACETHYIAAYMTSKDCSCGTDRLSELVKKLDIPDEEIIVNVQGDEPLIPPELINEVAEILSKKPECSIGTAASPMHSISEFENPNAVKVVVDEYKKALLFSRSPIPWDRDRFSFEDGKLIVKDPEALLKEKILLRHIGIYSYRADFLRIYPTLSKSLLEEMEKLEQLRAMWHGYQIAVTLWEKELPPGVDTMADLEKVRGIVKYEREN